MEKTKEEEDEDAIHVLIIPNEYCWFFYGIALHYFWKLLVEILCSVH